MTIQQTIEKAIEGGYGYQGFTPGTGDYRSHVNTLENGDTFLDPLFWQALGRALGWYSEKPLYQINNQPAPWAYYWHLFIDHLAEGGDAESFFKQF